MQEEEFNDGRDAREAERRRLERQEKMAAKKQQRLLQHVSLPQSESCCSTVSALVLVVMHAFLQLQCAMLQVHPAHLLLCPPSLSHSPSQLTKDTYSLTHSRTLSLTLFLTPFSTQVDPELVDTHFLRPHDHTIRATDLPERLQLLGKPILEVRGGV